MENTNQVGDKIMGKKNIIIKIKKETGVRLLEMAGGSSRYDVEKLIEGFVSEIINMICEEYDRKECALNEVNIINFELKPWKKAHYLANEIIIKDIPLVALKKVKCFADMHELPVSDFVSRLLSGVVEYKIVYGDVQ